MILLIILSSIISFPHQINGIIEIGQITSEHDWQNDEFWEYELRIASPTEQELLYGQNCIELDELWPIYNEKQPLLIPHRPSHDIQPMVDKNQNLQRMQVADPSNSRRLQNVIHSSAEPLQEKIAESNSQIIKHVNGNSQHFQNAGPSSQNIQDESPSFQRPSNKRRSIFTNDEEKEILMECAKLKRENPKFNYVDCAVKFGIHRTTLTKWRKKHGIPFAIRKREIIDEKEFAKIYNEIKEQNPGIKDKDVAKMMNLSESNLSHRKKRIGQQKSIKSNKHFTTNEQEEMLMECAKLKRENPKFNDRDCAAKFGIHHKTLYFWRKKHVFLEENLLTDHRSRDITRFSVDEKSEHLYL